MNQSISFITNEENTSLKARFAELIRDTAHFDCLVGYFYASGFHALYPALVNTEKIRILIGLGTDAATYDRMHLARNATQQSFDFSHAEAKTRAASLVVTEMNASEDSAQVEAGVHTFIDWIRREKLEIRAYPTHRLHAKLYIMTFHEDDRDVGRVITGSSNFSQSGMVDNLEFNVELPRPEDHHFALKKFNELWADSVDIAEKYVQTIENQTWLAQHITPYQLYLKFLYEYFKDELNQQDEVDNKYLPAGFMKLAYQEQAVLNAKKILLEYGGVFISDVVGLGKTYITAMLAGQLDGRTLVIAPPVLLDKSNPGSWYNVFNDFQLPLDCESIGKLDSLLARGVDKYDNVIIDEAHRNRSDVTITYEKLATICRGKRIILVTATPYNNTPKDILNLLKLFQNARNSTIPNMPDLESFFSRLERRLKKLDRRKDFELYIKIVRENAQEIRDKVLKYLMVRRTRTEIERYFSDDIVRQGLRFPTFTKPTPLFYQLNKTEDAIFNKTIQLISASFKYARYTPMLYYNGPIDQLERQSQRNLGRFMRILLVKRLESSFYAFRKSIERFIKSYEQYLMEWEKGYVYVSTKHFAKVFELLESGEEEVVEQLIEAGKTDRLSREDFQEALGEDLQHDLILLKEIRALWRQIDRDPKLEMFRHRLASDAVLQKNHLIIFTESTETAQYLHQQLDELFPDTALLFSGGQMTTSRQEVIENFDARAAYPKDDYRILIATEVLAEGVNLHRANVVINYDIPWNPTRMMQRVGRINRVDTSYSTLYTYNFFPTTQSNEQIKLKEAAVAKINAFLTLLGGDAELLTDGEPIDSHELFDRLCSAKSLEAEEGWEDSELRYLKVIRDLREQDPKAFAKIKGLPAKARSAKAHDAYQNALLTYFRRGKVQKFFLAAQDEEARELDFFEAARLLESTATERRTTIKQTFFPYLDKNKAAFIKATTAELAEPKPKRGRDSAANLLRLLKAVRKQMAPCTDEQEAYLDRVLQQLEHGAIPRKTCQKTLRAVEKMKHVIHNPLKVLGVLQTHIPTQLLQSHYADETPTTTKKREVILSMYFTGADA